MNMLLQKLNENGDLPKSGVGLDIGFGSGRDLKFLSGRGLKMIGVEKNEDAFEVLQKEIGKNKDVKLLNIPAHKYDFDHKFSVIVINNVLPFMTKDQVIFVAKKGIESLENGGFLLATLFGLKDEWFGRDNMSFFKYEEAKDLFNAEYLEPYFTSTEEGFGLTKSGEKKFWHIHRFIVRKK